jgi:hypothetical protein
VKRLRPVDKKKLLTEAELLAEERARLFRMARRNSKGEALTGHRLTPVTGERHRRNLINKGARPVLASSEWRAIYEEVGLA